MKRNRKGFTLIELLIVVAIIGIIVAIAIPNLLNAIQRAKQKRSMADMRSAGTAAEAYAVDFNHYPAAAGYSLPSGLTVPTGTFGAVGSGFNKQVAPTYIRLLPITDGWQSYFLYGNNGAHPDGLRDHFERERRHRRHARRRRDDELQRRHRLHERPVRSVPRGRAAVSPPASRPKEPPRGGSFSFWGPFPRV